MRSDFPFSIVNTNLKDKDSLNPHQKTMVKDSASIRKMFTKRFNDNSTKQVPSPTNQPYRNLCKFRSILTFTALATKGSPTKRDNKNALLRIGTIIQRVRSKENPIDESSSFSDIDELSNDSYSATENKTDNVLDLTQRPPETFIDLFEREKEKKEKKLKAVNNSERTKRVHAKKSSKINLAQINTKSGSRSNTLESQNS